MQYVMPLTIALSLIAGAIKPCWGDGETVAVFTKNQNNPFSHAIRIGSNSAAKNLAAKIHHYVPSTPDSVAEQIGLVDDAIGNKPDAIVFDPVDITALVPAVERMNAAGIPVINIADRIASEKLVAYVGADDYKIGLETARHILNAMGGAGNVVILEGIQGNLTNTARLQGFNDALTQHPGSRLLASKSGNYQRRQAQDVMEILIRSFPQIDGVIAANDAMAIGALEALEKRNRRALVVGINGSKEAVELIKSGKLLASGEFSGFVAGCLGTEIAIQNLRKQPIPKELILKPVVIDKTNYQQYEARIEQRKCPKLDAEGKLDDG